MFLSRIIGNRGMYSGGAGLVYTDLQPINIYKLGLTADLKPGYILYSSPVINGAFRDFDKHQLVGWETSGVKMKISCLERCGDLKHLGSIQ